MKSFMTACFLAFVATQIVAAEKCSTQAECPDANKCCAGIPPFGGNCLNHTPEGGKCHLEDKIAPVFFGEYIIGPCPCAEGLICESTGGKKKNDGVCVKAPTPAPVVPEATDDTPVEEPAADDTPVEEPAADDTPVEEPAADSSAADDTPAEEPAADSSAADDTTAEESAADSSAADDTPAEEPAADSSAAEEPAADSSAADSAPEA